MNSSAVLGRRAAVSMVMAAGSMDQPFAADELSHEAGEASGEASAEASALHERLVAYVHALAGGHDARSGVWVEHSYARSRGAAHAPPAHVRVLLAPRLEPEPDAVDVERAEPPPPELPAPPEPADGADDSDEDDEWEARVAALAPSAVHARLASHALDTLRRMRLARLAAVHGHARLEAARAAARRLRRALAAASALPAPHQQRPGAWLHATLHAYMPRGVRRLYAELARELRRAAPLVAERSMGGSAPPPRADPLGAVGAPVPAHGSPWLLWVGCGCARQDERWRRRLGALLHTRVLHAGGAAPAAPEAWCAAVAGSVRAALADTLAEAGQRAVFLGGLGAGAALCAALAAAGGGGGRLRGLLLLAPPLRSAGGARDGPAAPLGELRLPLLLVAGGGARLAARGVLRARPERRLLELRGADGALRLPAALRRRLPQRALDAAVAEECARWALETAEGPRAESPPRERPRRREPRAADEEEYAHLPNTAARPAPSDGPDRAIEVVAEFMGRRGADSSLEVGSGGAVGRGSGGAEGRGSGGAEGRGSGGAEGRSSGGGVVRGSGGTPLALPPPRRRSPPPPRRPPAPLGAADIMRLPIVFADDEPAAAGGEALTVTSGSARRGAARYARVIVASRGARGPVLLRRGLRLLPRD